MELPEEVVGEVRKRLRRVEGQIRGVERMLEEGRECRDIVTQLRREPRPRTGRVPAHLRWSHLVCRTSR